jgi:uncharacterized protein (DUF1499 family)
MLPDGPARAHGIVRRATPAGVRVRGGSDVAQTTSRLAAGAAGIGTLAVLGGFGGAALARLGVLAPLSGFGLFALGGLLGLVAVIVALLGLRATRVGSGLAGRERAWLGLVAGGAMLAAVASGASAGRGLPRINDITTDPADPPAFEYATRDPETRERDYSYPAGFAEQQRAAYPDLAPIALSLPPDRAFEAALAAAQSLGLEVAMSDKERGVIEARATSNLFRFVDDVAIRVRPVGSGSSVVDIRSKSRDGKGDLGANANRIRSLTTSLAAAK